MAGAVFLAAAGLLIWLWPNAPSPFPGNLPTPNGYDDLVSAGNALRPDTGDTSRKTTEELRTLVAENTEALRLMREGLSKECVVPIQPSVASMQGHLQDMTFMKRLAWLSAGNARLSEVEMNYGKAALIHLDTVRLGHYSARGGLMIDKLVGVAIEAIGIQGLDQIVERLSATEAREILQAIEAIESHSSPASEFIARDREWARASLGITSRIQEWLLRRFTSAPDQQFISKVETADRRRRQLMHALTNQLQKLDAGKTSSLSPIEKPR